MIERKPKLLPIELLIKTGKFDHADWNYSPILGYIQRKRFQLCLSFLEGKKYNKILEIGYGSGIFIPELARWGNTIMGIDIHNYNKEVEKKLKQVNIETQLYCASAADIPFDNDYFDCIVSISTIEFIYEIENACNEIIRVLKKDGSLIVITPGHSPIVDTGLKILTGKNAKDDYENRREKVVPCLLRYFTLQEKKTFPANINVFPILYTALKLSPNK